MKALASIAAILLASACKRSEPADPAPISLPSPPKAALIPTAKAKPASPAPPASALPSADGPAPSADEPAPKRSSSRLSLGPALPVGPAGSVLATSEGALFRLEDDEIALARWNPKGGSGPQRLPLAKQRAVFFAPPPAFAENYAYFTSRGRLVRRSLEAKSMLEVLTTDAIDGSRVAAKATSRGAVVAYIAEPALEDGDRRARLWVEGQGSFDLSPEGSGATSVAIEAIDERRLLIAYFEGRTALAPIHARILDDAASGPVELGPDVVLTVAPPSEAFTEMALAPSPGGPIALVPLSRDPRSFGLMSLVVGKELRMDGEPRWTIYPNGIDPAPVATASLCGESWVAFTRPEAEAPSSPMVIELGTVEEDGRILPHSIAAEDPKIRSVSLATSGRAALLVWTASGRSFARVLRC